MLFPIKSNDYQRIMTINGRAGSGKTVLACRVLQHLENGEFPNELGALNVGGIIYLSEISNYKINVANIFSGLLQVIEPQKAGKLEQLYKEAKVPIDEKIRYLLNALPPRPVVLLLDNFENLLDAADNINDQELYEALKAILQADLHFLKILITTRTLPRGLSQIETARQFIKHLDEGLPSPHAENVLRKMDKDGRAGLRDAIDELLGGIREATLGYPRALEAFYSIICVDRYSNVEELLIEGIPKTVVEKYVGEAFSRLDPISQKAIQALAIYNRPVSYAAVDFALQFHVLGINSASILERLVSMHFVRREAKRYFLHPADQEYALSRMPKGNPDKRIGQGARARTWDRHSLTLRAADYFVEVRKPKAEWKNLSDLSAQLAEFDLRCDAGDYDTAASVLTEIDFDYLLLWGHFRLALDLREKLEGNIKDFNLARINVGITGKALLEIGNIRQAIVCFDKAIVLSKATMNRQAEGVYLNDLGNAYTSWGEARKAIEFYEQSLAIAHEISDRSSVGSRLGNLGVTYSNLGEERKAIEFYEQALVIARETGDRRGEANSLANLGTSYAYLGEVYKALDLYKEALVIARLISDRGGERALLGNLGNRYADLGDMSQAIDLCEQALVIARETGNLMGEAICLENIGSGFLDFEEYRKSQEYIEQSIRIADQISFQPMQQFGRSRLSEVYL